MHSVIDLWSRNGIDLASLEESRFQAPYLASYRRFYLVHDD